MSTAGTLLITGVTGCIGRAVLSAARRSGWSVRGLARHAPREPWPEGVDVVLGDVRDRAAVERAATGCATIVHLAGWVHRIPRDEHDVSELRSSIIDGTATVASVAAAMTARLVMTSSVAVFGHTPYGEAKLEAEKVALAACPGAIILRPAVVYGPHDRGNVRALIAAIERRLGFIVGDGANRKSMVYVDNLADRIVASLARADLAGTWIAADDPAPTQAELAREIARALGRRPPLSLPRWPLATVAGVVDRVACTNFRDRVLKLSQNTEFPGAALDRALGYAPRVSWQDAIRTTVGAHAQAAQT